VNTIDINLNEDFRLAGDWGGLLYPLRLKYPGGAFSPKAGQVKTSIGCSRPAINESRYRTRINIPHAASFERAYPVA
jgi:hypothetical protein